MSTYYKFIDDLKGGEIGINESSNNLQILVYNPWITSDEELVFSSSELSPEEMLKILLKGIQVCSYWMYTDEFKNQVKTFLEKEIY